MSMPGCVCMYMYHLSRYQLGVHAVWGPANVQRPWSQNVDETSTKDTRSSTAEDAQEYLPTQHPPQETVCGQ